MVIAQLCSLVRTESTPPFRQRFTNPLFFIRARDCWMTLCGTSQSRARAPERHTTTASGGGREPPPRWKVLHRRNQERTRGPARRGRELLLQRTPIETM